MRGLLASNTNGTFCFFMVILRYCELASLADVDKRCRMSIVSQSLDSRKGKMGGLAMGVVLGETFAFELCKKPRGSNTKISSPRGVGQSDQKK